ncbi:response regulator transcription factor [Cryobacterium breve]|uniref:Response regulator transcription factor n=1 Tax=Cryobacterium breve TaxID=1259258 RepID=A0ABY7NF41_9MICO|nr:response regulator transcription factor [Cryobacterium breve]
MVHPARERPIHTRERPGAARAPVSTEQTTANAQTRPTLLHCHFTPPFCPAKRAIGCTLGLANNGWRARVAQLLILTSAVGGEVLPALALLSHGIRVIPAQPDQLITAPDSDVILVDARTNLMAAKSLCQIMQTTGSQVPLLLVITEGGLAAVSPGWGIDDVILDTAGPAEVDARIRLAAGRTPRAEESALIRAAGVVIDEASYSAKVYGRPLDLTYKEFELLRFLAAHPSRVFTREQLLSEVWGYDYFGGTRTVDVHVRRLRAKLGDQESLIGTVRNVGYRFNVQEPEVVRDQSVARA